MDVSRSQQPTQAKVLYALQVHSLGRGYALAPNAKGVATIAGITRQQAAAALFLLERRGLVKQHPDRARSALSRRRGPSRWTLTDQGLTAAVQD